MKDKILGVVFGICIGLGAALWISSFQISNQEENIRHLRIQLSSAVAEGLECQSNKTTGKDSPIMPNNTGVVTIGGDAK